MVCAEDGGAEDAQKAGMDKFRVKAGSAAPKVCLPVLANTDEFMGVAGSTSSDDKGNVQNGALTVYAYKRDKCGPSPLAVVR